MDVVLLGYILAGAGGCLGFGSLEMGVLTSDTIFVTPSLIGFATMIMGGVLIIYGG